MAAHVRAVETLLRQELDELEAGWLHLAAGIDAPFATDLPAQLRALLESGGKRTRPAMTALGWEAVAVSGERRGYEDMVRAAAAIELLHCFALIHDDVMDESDSRRGQPTVHELARREHARRAGRGSSIRFGESIAMLVGDLAHSEADRLAAGLPGSMRLMWRQLVLELLAGQTWDVTGSAAADRRLSFARRVARQKTGFYTVARPLQLGAAAAGADDETLTALGDYGRHAGEAFALRDELLGVYGDPATTGKPAGDDLRSGKPTVLLAIAAESLRGPAAEALRVVGTAQLTDAQVALLQHAMTQQGVVARVEAMIDQRIDDALVALRTDRLGADGIARLTDVLADLARRAS